jgi:hypothetical protein
MSQAVADSVRHLPRVAINRTSDLAPDADYIFALDAVFWRENLDYEQRAGVKVSLQQRMRIKPNVPAWVRVMQWGGCSGFDERPGYLRSGGCSGAAALHFAASIGAREILLFGFDCHGGHWHGEHISPLANPKEATFGGWIKNFEKLAPILKARGVSVVNCTPGSRLECFASTPLAA